MPPRLRSSLILAAFLSLTVPLMPVQWLLARLLPTAARRLPHHYHRAVCRLIGVRIATEGVVERDRPVLIVANHVSWLDIPVLSAVAPVTFIAKREVADWPMVGQLARLQGVIFVDRKRRQGADRTVQEIADRLRQGGAIVLFAEGTSSDGASVRPFMSTLFAAIEEIGRAGGGERIAIQTIGLAYRRIHGLPVTRTDRPMIGFYGDMDMRAHALDLLGAGPVDAKVRIGPALALSAFADRKSLARACETAVRAAVVALNREVSGATPVDVAEPPRAWRTVKPRPSTPGDGWT